MKKIIFAFFLGFCCIGLRAAGENPLKSTDKAFFSTPEAARIGEQVLLWQRNTGGWPKNVDMAAPLSESERSAVLAAKDGRKDSTIDNEATTTQMLYLARLYAATGEKRWRDGFRRGLQFIFDGQYANGGWPQFWPEFHVKYAKHITFNDGAMETVMLLLRGIAEKEGALGSRGLVSCKQRKQAAKAFERGVECILNCQIVVDGRPTVWCQQHDENTLEPAPARAFELASYCSSESAGLVELLMSLDNPSERVKSAIHGAMAWFEANKILGYEIVHTADDTYLRPHPDKPALWARFYDLQECKPFFCGRDGIMKRDLSEIEPERRNGYRWYSDGPAKLYPKYLEWCRKNGEISGRAELRPGKTAIHLAGDSTMAPKDTSKGNPERGWGMYFGEYFDSGIVVYNYAKNGRSTKSFIADGRWKRLLACVVPGDYVFIEFGHNDSKADDPVRYAAPWSDYQDNLRRMVRDTRELGGIPVLLTPVARRKFSGKGVFDRNSHGDYPAAMKAVAAETGTVLIDMTSATSDWIEAAGDEASRQFFMWVESGECEAFPEGRRDNTHSRENGARRNCEIVCDSLRVKVPALAEHLR